MLGIRNKKRLPGRVPFFVSSFFLYRSLGCYGNSTLPSLWRLLCLEHVALVVDASWVLGCFEVTGSSNGVLKAGEKRWHRETRGSAAIKRALTSACARVALVSPFCSAFRAVPSDFNGFTSVTRCRDQHRFQEGQPCFRPSETPCGKLANASVGPIS